MSQSMQTIDLAAILASAGESITLSTEGEEKCGKTTFELTAPGPLGVIDFDLGIARAISGRPDLRAKLEMPGTRYESYSIRTPSGLNRKSDEDVLNVFRPVLKKLQQDFDAMVLDKGIRTIVIDTASALWKLIEYVGSGRMGNYPYQLRIEINATYTGMLDAIRCERKHAILAHRVKDEWKKDATGQSQQTGKMVRDGFGDSKYAVDANILLRAELVQPTPEKPDRVRFYTEFLRTGYNKKLLEGSVWENADWATVTSLMLG